MGFLSSAIGAIANIGSSVGLDRWKKTQADSERRDFFDYAREANYGNYLRSLREAPSAQRAGLEAAGFNPLLAIGSMSPSHFGGSSVSASPTDTYNSKGLLSEGTDTANNVKNMYRLQKKQAESTIDQIDSQAEKNRAEASLAQANERLIASREMLTRSQAANYDAETVIAKHKGELQKYLSQKEILELQSDLRYLGHNDNEVQIFDHPLSEAQERRARLKVEADRLSEFDLSLRSRDQTNRYRDQDIKRKEQDRASRLADFENSPEGFLWFIQNRYKDIPKTDIGKLWWDLFGGDDLDTSLKKRFFDTYEKR